MNFDRHTCAQARLSRDARFDGRFFIGVRSTHIYCRPICPVRAAKEENVTYFPTAAAAAEAGYRPCLRCRPESSPGTPAWSGTSATVARALRLISEGEIAEEGLEALAARLGLGTRQLRRLFTQHLGASPAAVIKTRRLHFAKKLIDETNLSFRQVSLVSGFGSVRRFNSAFRKIYGRPPSQIRKFANGSSGSIRPLEANEKYDFRLNFRPPFHWQALLQFLTQRAIPGVEAIEANTYARRIALNGSHGSLRVTPHEGSTALRVEIVFPEPRWLFQIIERVRHMFDLTADPREISAQLSNDPFLSARVEAMPGLRVPGCWDGFELAVRAVLGQQISLAGASTLAGRLVQSFGTKVSDDAPLTHLFPPPERLAEADIARIGLPSSRAETIRNLARSVANGRLTFDSVQDIAEFRSRLMEIPGIGDWTAQYIAMRALGDTDAFPAGDLHIVRSMSLTSARDSARRAEGWRPWRAYAAMYIWQTSGVKQQIAARSKKGTASVMKQLPYRLQRKRQRLLRT